MLRGPELLRLTTWLVLLAALGVIILQRRMPMAGNQPAQESPSAGAAGTLHGADRAAGAAGRAAAEAITAGPTDEDAEQQSDAEEELLAVRDGTVGLQPEEMLIYWRLFHWVDHQSFDQLRRRAQSHVTFGELMQFPDDYRGKLVSLDLNVRRVLSYDVEDSPAGIPRVYEVWAWAEDSHAWLYALVTAHLPAGMPVGADVYERARFVGYFLKLHGYYEAGAKPRAAPLRAPLLVGRFQKISPIGGVQPSPVYDWLALAAVMGMLVMLAAATVAQRLFARRTARQQAQRRGHSSESLRAWLQAGCYDSGMAAEGRDERDTAAEIGRVTGDR